MIIKTKTNKEMFLTFRAAIEFIVERPVGDTEMLIVCEHPRITTELILRTMKERNYQWLVFANFCVIRTGRLVYLFGENVVDALSKGCQGK